MRLYIQDVIKNIKIIYRRKLICVKIIVKKIILLYDK